MRKTVMRTETIETDVRVTVCDVCGRELADNEDSENCEGCGRECCYTCSTGLENEDSSYRACTICYPIVKPIWDKHQKMYSNIDEADEKMKRKCKRLVDHAQQVTLE